MHPIRTRFRWYALTAWMAAAALPAEPLPLYDAHLHYNAEALAAYPVPATIDLLRSNGIRGMLLSSTPNEGTRSLAAAAPGGMTVARFVRPYRTDADRTTWFRDEQTIPLLEAELARADYRGLGEFHVYGDDAASDVVRRVVELAATRGLYLLAHCDERALELILERDPAAKLIWAHSGFTVPPEQLARTLQRHPTLLAELSYRYDVTVSGHLTPEWRRLLVQFADRFVIGTDTWTNERWTRYGEIIAWYRGWLAELPAEVREAIAWRNAEQRFGR
jgi:Amidohydrolase